MDSSFEQWTFLTVINLGLGLYAGLLLVKMIIQFGLPNHPARITCYLMGLSAASFFMLQALVGLNLLAPFFWLKWRPLPLVVGSLALLFQVIVGVGSFSRIQQKVISRVPLIGGLLCLGMFPQQADYFFIVALIASSVFLTVSVGKIRYQKRVFTKMIFFLTLFGAAVMCQSYWVYVAGSLFLFGALFYFFLFEQAIGVWALVDDYKSQSEGQAS